MGDNKCQLRVLGLPFFVASFVKSIKQATSDFNDFEKLYFEKLYIYH
jgi:hypothetical protein